MVMFRTVSLLLVVSLAGCSPSSQAPEPSKAQASRAARPAAGSVEPVAPETPLQAQRKVVASQPDFALDARDTTVVDARVVRVALSNQGDTEASTIGAQTDRFLPSDTVYVQVETRGGPKAYTLYAKWIGSDGTVLADYGTRISKPGVQRTVISLSKPDGWASGRNRIELAINAQQAQVVAFQVK